MDPRDDHRAPRAAGLTGSAWGVRTLGGADILRVWEQGVGRDGIERALLILEAALPGAPREILARLDLGRRDALMFEVRRRLFGPEVRGQAGCPACEQAIEFGLDTSGLALAGIDPATFDTQGPVFRFEREDCEVDYRLPNGDDLAEAALCEDVASARALIVGRCLVRVRRPGTSMGVEDRTLPDSLVSALADEMTARDERAEVLLKFSCPTCDHTWRAPLDIASFLFAELAAQAKRLAREVHALAGAYGWPEAEILAMSPARRRLYLEIVAG